MRQGTAGTLMLFGSACLSLGPWGPGQMVEFKGTHGLVFPWAAFQLYMEVSVQLTLKPRSQPLASLLTPSSAADSGQSGKSVPMSVSVQHACQSGLNRGEKSRFL